MFNKALKVIMGGITLAAFGIGLLYSPIPGAQGHLLAAVVLSFIPGVLFLALFVKRAF